MKILIVGNGGREHALLWKLRRDAPEAEFFITLGNGGTAELARSIPVKPTAVGDLVAWASGNDIDLTVVGPEIPLADGIVDRFSTAGLAVFGPTHAAARIESSKAFAKELMARHGIPTARYRTFDELAAAERYVGEHGAPVVVKASGLAAGKGAVVCESVEDARSALRSIMGDHTLGTAGDTVVIEEKMEGEELSVFALTDGRNVLPMLPAQDHKRLGEGETGPNTGGMGAYAPVSIAQPSLMDFISNQILQPTIDALAADGHPFRGLLYAGLMLTADGPKVVEFNCRFGDPETQALLPLLDSTLLDPMLAIARGESVAGTKLRWHSAAAVTTVMASGGYPGPYRKGLPIEIEAQVVAADDLLLFHAGTARSEGDLVTTGGRVLAITALAQSVTAAAARGRWGAEHIHIEGSQYRRDIAWREAARQ
ncbi:MAG TPA: phosphoribosylamine--glycine ligase [Longimicrobiaceae bacterium]|nr:phosphoribosylamine--glycine ligase [Longimicrobiaceae bacterium]